MSYAPHAHAHTRELSECGGLRPADRGGVHIAPYRPVHWSIQSGRALRTPRKQRTFVEESVRYVRITRTGTQSACARLVNIACTPSRVRGYATFLTTTPVSIVRARARALATVRRGNASILLQ